MRRVTSKNLYSKNSEMKQDQIGNVTITVRGSSNVTINFNAGSRWEPTQARNEDTDDGSAISRRPEGRNRRRSVQRPEGRDIRRRRSRDHQRSHNGLEASTTAKAHRRRSLVCLLLAVRPQLPQVYQPSQK